MRADGISVLGRSGSACLVAVEPKVMSMVSMASAARAWRASAGLVAAVSHAIIWRAGRGMCRTAPRHPVACCKMAATWLKVRLSGPPSSRTWLCRPGRVAAWLTSAATSVAETKLTGLSPFPNTGIFPDERRVRP